jgi:invasion protein IalB
MNSLKKNCLVLIAVLALGAGTGMVNMSAFAADTAKTPAAAPAKGNEIIDHGWQQRCEAVVKDKPSHCEIFKKLETKEKSLRVAEFAVGYAPEKDAKKDTANSVIILPLGMLLDSGVTMKVDDGKELTFKPRFCNNGGCFSFVTLDEAWLSSMKKGKATNFQFKTSEGQIVNLVMKLDGFEKLLKAL